MTTREYNAIGDVLVASLTVAMLGLTGGLMLGAVYFDLPYFLIPLTINFAALTLSATIQMARL